MSTHVEQVGGDHYQSKAEGQQHWDFIERYDIDYLTATGTKYLCRWRKKGNPKEDLGKAISYFEKALLCRPDQITYVSLRNAPLDDFERWAVVNDFDPSDVSLLRAVLCWGSRNDYVTTIVVIRQWIADLP